MPLSSLTCPICLAVLKPKTAVAEGSRVRCPKCKGSFAAEGEPKAAEPEPDLSQQPMPDAVEQPAPHEEILDAVEAVEDEPPESPRDRPRRRDNEDDRPRRRRADEEDEGEDRPRSVRKKGGIPAWVWLAGGGVGLLLLCGCCGVGGAVLWSTMGGSGPVSVGNYNQLKKGMTSAEVHNILGPPTSSFGFGGAQTETWQNQGDFITVNYINGKAASRSCNIQHNGMIQLTDNGLVPW